MVASGNVQDDGCIIDYFPVEDAEYEQKLIPGAKIERIPSIWGHNVVGDPAAIDFLNSKKGPLQRRALSGGGARFS